MRSADGYSLVAWRNLGTSEVRPGIELGIDPVDALLTSLRQVAVVAVVFAVVVGSLAAVAIAAAE